MKKSSKVFAKNTRYESSFLNLFAQIYNKPCWSEIFYTKQCTRQIQQIQIQAVIYHADKSWTRNYLSMFMFFLQMYDIVSFPTYSTIYKHKYCM